MNITISQPAVDELFTNGFDKEASVLLIDYETDGCGCVVSGVSKLIDVPYLDLTDDHKLLTTSPADYRVAIQKRFEWVYDTNMTIDYSSTVNMFQLKSPNEMLNPRMRFDSFGS